MTGEADVEVPILLQRHLRWMLAALLVVVPVRAAGAQTETRADEIRAERARKAASLTPDRTSGFESGLVYIKENRLLERILAGFGGFRAKLGGMVTGGGFGIGPEFHRPDLAGGKVGFRSAAQISTRTYERYEIELQAPRFARDHLFAELYAVRHNYPGINYYGPGPRSRIGDRSNYRLEDTAVDGTFGVAPVPQLKLGGTVGYLWVNVGPGQDSRFISTERLFSPATTPGIDRQSNFLRYGAFAQYDYRDNPAGPRGGGNYVVQFDVFSDRKLELHDFQRLDVELQQYFPFFNQRRVFALRARSILTFTDPGQRVPFYLQPSLGGSDDLRGFRPFRFHDDNMIALNAEYRWEVSSGLDMALFADGGKVFADRSQWNLRNLEGAYGFGLRFNARNHVFFRIDVGFGREIVGIWVKFDNIFGRGRSPSSSNFR